MTEPQKPPPNRLRKFVDRMPLDPNKPRHFGILSFLECTILPMPLEVITAPFMIAYPRKAIRMAIAMWIACLLGTLLLYGIGLALYEPVVIPILDLLGQQDNFDAISARFTDEGLFWTVFTVGLMPMPLQLASLSVGVMNGNFAIFFLAVIFSRGLRYFGLALMCRFLGERVERIFASRWFGLVLFVLCIIALTGLYRFVLL